MKNHAQNLISRIANLLVDSSIQRMVAAGVLVGDEEQFGVLGALHWLREQLFQIIPLEQFADIQTYATANGILLHIPGVSARDSPGFENLFQPLPEGKLQGGYLEIGEWDRQTGTPAKRGRYPWEDSIDLHLGPDGQVWALVGSLEQIPVSREKA